MPIFLHDTLSGKKESFKPIAPKKVGMYHCGPTVYNYTHIGNLRSYVFADVLRRTLEYNDYKVKQVINITDVGHLSSDADDGEDKMTKALRREGKSMTLEAMREVGEFYTKAFVVDLKALNILLPHEMPRASDHIKGDIELIKILEGKSIAYKTNDGVYFDTSRFPEYGKLGRINLAGQKEGARVGVNEEKRNPTDFALWKFSSTAPLGAVEAREDAELTQNYAEKESQLGFESPWGKGFPGWHIECSAMSAKYLGQPFDIHTGGIDHIPVHHNNEIAQSESAYEKPLANYWLHNEHLILPSGDKMAKSGENFITLLTLKEKGMSPLAYRYYLLGANYKTPMVWSEEAMEGARNSYEKLLAHFLSLGDKDGKIDENYQQKFQEKINDALNPSIALSLIWEVLGDQKLLKEIKRATLLDFDRVLGLGLANLYAEPIPPEVQKLSDEREIARKNQNWKMSDILRKKIEGMGYKVHDEVLGPLLYKL